MSDEKIVTLKIVNTSKTEAFSSEGFEIPRGFDGEVEMSLSKANKVVAALSGLGSIKFAVANMAEDTRAYQTELDESKAQMTGLEKLNGDQAKTIEELQAVNGDQAKTIEELQAVNGDLSKAVAELEAQVKVLEATKAPAAEEKAATTKKPTK